MRRVVFAIFSILFILMIYFVTLDNEKMMVSLDRCVDGDTAWFSLNGKSIKVRFLGIDTPEISDGGNNYSKEALKYSCDKLSNADSIYLEYDDNSDRYDKYNRMLAWVFVDGANLSELLVRNGYAMVRYVYDDYLYVDDLCKAQSKARNDKKGIWGINNNSYIKDYCKKNT